jgi:ribonuclease HII
MFRVRSRQPLQLECAFNSHNWALPDEKACKYEGSGLGFEEGMKTRLLAGLDENGVGPLLGPMVVTLALAEVTAAGEAYIRGYRAPGTRSRQTERLGGRLDDSKVLASFKDSRASEAWARASAEAFGMPSATPRELLTSLSLDPEAALRAPCPKNQHGLQCWESDGEFLDEEDLLIQTRKDVASLAKYGVRLKAIRSIILCTERINEAGARGINRFKMDLHAMERLIEWAHTEHDGTQPLDVVCGKVGGFRFYDREFGPLAGLLRTTLEESRSRSAYTFPSLGTVAFVQDADANDGLVALASLVGKWVRDKWTARIIRHHAQNAKIDGITLPHASGYHDPVTQAFVRKSALIRKHAGFPDACFARTKAAPTNATTKKAKL